MQLYSLGELSEPDKNGKLQMLEMTSLHDVLMYTCSIFNQFQGSINSKQAIELRGIPIENSEYHYTTLSVLPLKGAALF